MLSLIAAVDRRNALGKDNRLLWHLPADLQRFRRLTTGHKIIMGRKTFESLPGILSHRHHLVLTRNRGYPVDDDRVTVLHSLEELWEQLDPQSENFVIGGGEIYRLLLPYADKIYLTVVEGEFEADTFFPKLDDGEWEVVSKVAHPADGKNPLPYTFIDLSRRR